MPQRKPPIVVIDGTYGNPNATQDTSIGRVIEWSDPTAPARAPDQAKEIALDYEPRRLWVRDHYEELSDAEANFFKAILDRPGGWLNAISISPNAAQTKRRMRPVLQDLIDSDRHKGYRIKP
jgi:hypothetical protein